MSLSAVFYALSPFLTLLQGLIFTILCLIRWQREERYSDFWLALTLFLLGINGVPYMLGWMGIDFLWEKWTYMPWDGFWLAASPSLYLFLKSLTNETWRFRRKDLWHFLPYAFYFVEHTIVGTLIQLDRSFMDKWENGIFGNYFDSILSYAVSIYYFYLSFRLYRSYRLWCINYFSDTERVAYRWFRNALIVSLGLFIIGTLNSFYGDYISSLAGRKQYDVMWLGYFADAVLIYYLSISAYTQARVRGMNFVEKAVDLSTILKENKPILTENQQYPELIAQNSQLETQNSENTEGVSEAQNEAQKNLKAGLTEADLGLWKKKVLTYFEKEEPYLNPELSLSELAEKLKTNTSILSAVINSGFGKNFNDFVNEYRVAAFKSKIGTPQYRHLTLLAVAFDCGFNSKTTFNRAFKKLVGVNPSDFQV